MSKLNFLNEMTKNSNLTTTTNGAIVYSTSMNDLLDFFGTAGSMRDSSATEIIALFDKAYKEDKLRAIKCVFYLGDILQGQGERRTFKILLKHIANNYTEDLKNNIHLIPHYNRWDSIYALFDTPLESNVIDMIKHQLLLDVNSDNCSLCAKWLKSCNASSTETKKLGRKTARLLNLGNFPNPESKESKKKNEFIYRKVLSKLRAKINVVESNMSAKSWDKINYNQVPSKAMANYKEAFDRNDSERFGLYIEGLKTGETKINSKALYPYEIVKNIMRNPYHMNDMQKSIAEAQWNSLPNYITNPDMKGLCVVDVSGSMSGIPMEVAISLGLYVSERCTGVYHNKFITFSENPSIVDVKGDTIFDKVNNMRRADWGYNTNLEKVFDLILNTAIKNKAPQTDIPSYLIVITDMGWDKLEGNSRYKGFGNNTFIESIRNRFESHGYKMPILVLWNVDSDVFPMTADENGWISISGYSPTVFKALLSEELLGAEDLEAEKINPVDAMLVILDGERYNSITINQ